MKTLLSLALLTEFTLMAALDPAVLLAETTVKEPTPSTEKNTEFPLDLPKVSQCGGSDCNVKEYEFDAYLGASAASGGRGGGLGFTGRIEKDDFWKNGMGSMATFLVDGGVYGIGAANGGGTSLVMDADPEWDVGYYDAQAAISGWGAHAMVTPINGGATFSGGTGNLYSYTPAIDIGLHGRDAQRNSPWELSLEAGASLGYGTGVYRKLDATTGTLVSSVIDPYLYLGFTTDQKIGQTFLRVHLAGSDRIDSIGAQGVRNILNLRGYAWLKASSHLYTGPAITCNYADKQANLATLSYVPAPTVATITWDVGYTW